MDVGTAIRTRRTIRRYQKEKVSQLVLDQLLELMRYYPSAANLQPLKFMIVTEDIDLAFMQQILKWAGYIPGYSIEADEYPSAYILVLGDLSISGQFEFAAGSAVTQLLLAIHGEGLGGCCLGIPKQMLIHQHFGLEPERYRPLYAVAVGYPKHTAEAVEFTCDCKYTVDQEGNFLVPKRSVSEIVLKKEK